MGNEREAKHEEFSIVKTRRGGRGVHRSGVSAGRGREENLLVVDDDTTGKGDPEHNDDSGVDLLLVLLGATAGEDAVGGLCAHAAVTGGAYGRGAVASDGVVAGLLVDREALHGEGSVVLGHCERCSTRRDAVWIREGLRRAALTTGRCSR